ncbi:MAG: hypothetical protein AAF478_13230 [Pseudomonadota bacterium]
MSPALEDIAAERQRQLEKEGWTLEHDDTHINGEMATAAACYALAVVDEQDGGILRLPDKTPYVWPWDDKWWKPCDRRRNLVKAGALIIAEIERLDRITENQE